MLVLANGANEFGSSRREAIFKELALFGVRPAVSPISGRITKPVVGATKR